MTATAEHTASSTQAPTPAEDGPSPDARPGSRRWPSSTIAASLARGAEHRRAAASERSR